MFRIVQKKIKKTICFDIDGVICRTIGNNYKDSKPIKKNIHAINQLYMNGYTIKIFTARYMGRHKDIVNKAKKQGYKFTKKKLNEWGLKYHKLIFGKPSFDLIIDDKAIFFNNNWSNRINKILKNI